MSRRLLKKLATISNPAEAEKSYDYGHGTSERRERRLFKIEKIKARHPDERCPAEVSLKD